MKTRSFSVLLAMIFIFLNVLLWLALGIIGINTHPALSVPPQLNTILGILSIGIAGLLLGLFVLMRKGNHNAYYLIVAFFVVISLLTIFANVGLANILVLILNIVPIILLIKDRKQYLVSKSRTDTNG
jgi:hypothetical protein